MQNDNKKVLFSWLNPEILLGLPGDFAVGYFMVTGTLMCSPSLLAIGAGVFLLICLMGLSKTAGTPKAGFAMWCGLYRLAAVLLGGFVAGLNFPSWNVLLVAVFFGVYGFGCGKVLTLSKRDEPARPSREMLLLLVTSVLCSAYCLLMAFYEHGFDMGLWLVMFLVVWMLVRTVNFAVVLKGYNSPERLRQAGGLLFRGVLMLQGMVLVTFLEGIYALAGFIAIFVFINIQTIACKFIR